VKDAEALKQLIQKLVTNFRLPYFTISLWIKDTGFFKQLPQNCLQIIVGRSEFFPVDFWNEDLIWITRFMAELFFDKPTK